MIPPIRKILISSRRLQRRVAQIAAQINRDYAGEELVLLSILKGSIVFLSDLMKRLDLDVEIGFLYLSSYRGETAPQDAVQEYILPFPVIENRHVLLVEDIFDTGASLAHALRRCQAHHPKSLKTCILLVKKKEGQITVPVDYFGFEILDHFVVGYGLDYREKYRHLPCIALPHLVEVKS